MPDAARAGFRVLPDFSQRQGQPPVLTSSNPLSTLHRRFACARLSQPCLPESCPGVSAALTTIAFDNSSLRWLEVNTCLPTSKGPPPSLVQLRMAVWTGDARDTRPIADIDGTGIPQCSSLIYAIVWVAAQPRVDSERFRF